ncbi:hypothetical protein CQ018_06090 [Arthrobacter sp. MYb227]|uniref:alternate-type signal peptide domain-containing protein n=1 Tax=Arthrobacter sp. MYb227 TaxID=1848601 RepID=UPI000CFD66B0|nr:alternate-type signal peptide domain-containing protein [Arthrobacter sp. MYb227]PQZ94908.1 hypothetical protein CQ018_06090 [Arthrobacter sp. MYb227]
MKKVTKATIAAAAAGVLLLGGAGTIAQWSDTKNLDAGSVSTGHLTLDATTAGTWSDTSPNAANTTFDPALDHLVPGDTVVFEQTVKIGADGKNLKGELVVGNLDSVVPATLVGQVTVAVVPNPIDPKLTTSGSVVSFSEPGSFEVPVTITVAFAKGTPGSTPVSTMEQEMLLTDLALTLNQVSP